jgi:hypothetical protein
MDTKEVNSGYQKLTTGVTSDKTVAVKSLSHLGVSRNVGSQPFAADGPVKLE